MKWIRREVSGRNHRLSARFLHLQLEAFRPGCGYLDSEYIEDRNVPSPYTGGPFMAAVLVGPKSADRSRDDDGLCRVEIELEEDAEVEGPQGSDLCLRKRPGSC